MVLPLTQQRFGLLGTLRIFVPDLTEELGQLLIPCPLGVLYVLVVDLYTLSGMEKHASTRARAKKTCY